MPNSGTCNELMIKMMGSCSAYLLSCSTNFHCLLFQLFYFLRYSYSTKPHEFVMPYRLPTLTAAAAQAIQILNKLLSYVLDMNLPKASGYPNIVLQKGQHDITTDPRKVRFYDFLTL